MGIERDTRTGLGVVDKNTIQTAELTHWCRTTSAAVVRLIRVYSRKVTDSVLRDNCRTYFRVTTAASGNASNNNTGPRVGVYRCSLRGNLAPNPMYTDVKQRIVRPIRRNIVCPVTRTRMHTQNPNTWSNTVRYL